MGTFSIWHWLIVLAVVVILFGGGGKLSRLMGDFGKGLKSFKRNMSDDTASDEDKRQLEADKPGGQTESSATEKETANR